MSSKSRRKACIPPGVWSQPRDRSKPYRGPTSTSAVSEMVSINAAIASSSSVQRTGLEICETAHFFASAPEVIRFPVTFEKRGIEGSAKATLSRTFANSSPALIIRGEWKGPATLSLIARRAPAALKAASAAVRDSSVPEITV